MFKGAASAADKEQRISSRMRINKRIGQISASLEQVRNVARDLKALLDECQSREALYHFCLFTIAEKVSDQCETQLSAHMPSAYPLAHTCLLLVSSHPTLLTMLLGRLYDKSPFIIPHYYLPSDFGNNNIEYMRAAGYKVNESGELTEKEETYCERQYGFVAFFAALIFANTRLEPGLCPDTLGISIGHGWLWLARICNMKPRRVTPGLINAFLELLGPELFRFYPQSMRKLTELLQRDFLARVSDKAIAAKTRLEIFLRDAIVKKNFCMDPVKVYE